MSSSKSNISNESSRSNLLTLSQDSQSSQLKSHRANIYYKKFISKLGFLFRIDTQDLDALYNKIAQCLQEGQGLTQTDDADINQLIEMAKQLQYNHSLLKNMVEILDRRFLKKSYSQEIDVNRSQKFAESVNVTPESKKLQKQTHVSTPVIIKNKYQHQSENKQFELRSNYQSPDQISGLFNNTLQQARSQIRRKKQQQSNKKIQENNSQKLIEIGSVANEKFKGPLTLSGSKYEGRVQKIFQQMSKIKNQLSKIQSTSQYTYDNEEQRSSGIMGTQFAHGSTTQSLPEDTKYKFDSQHQTFKQVQEDTYFLVDDRFIKQQPSTAVPKLSLKQLYAKMGMDSDDDENQPNSIAMGIIRETSRESDNDFFQNNKQQFHLSNSESNMNAERANVQSLKVYKDSEEEPMSKTKSVNGSTSVQNATQNSDHNLQKQGRKNQFQQQRYPEQRSLPNENITELVQQTSLQGSNATYIEKLNFNHPTRKNTNTSIIDNVYYNQNQETAFQNKKQYTNGSIETTTMVHSSSLPQFEVNRNEPEGTRQKYIENGQSFFKKFSVEENGQQKIHGYLQKLEQRNKKLKNYVTQIELNILKQKQLREQIGLKSQQGKSLTASNSKTLTNLVYTDNEIITPKYIPNTLESSELKFKSMKIKTQETRLSNLEERQDERKMHRIYLEQNSYFDVSQSNNNFQKSRETPKVPYLTNLLENGDRKFEEIKKQSSNTKLKNLKNSLYLNKESQQNQNISAQDQKLSMKFKQDNIEKHDGQSSFKNIEIESKNSMNSIEDRMEQKNANLALNEEDFKKFIIAKTSNKSLFDQTRNVESKIQLSEDRTFKMRVPGEEIEKIKDRVNQMFKKIKSIKEDAGNLVKDGQVSPYSHQNPVKLQNKGLQFVEKTNNQTQLKKFQFKVPQQVAKKNDELETKKSSFIDKIQSSKRLIQDPIMQPRSPNSINFTYIAEQNPIKSSIVIDKCSGGFDKAKVSFINDQSRTNRSRQNSVGQGIQNKTNLLNSRESNFSFRNPIPSKFGQDSIRSSLTGPYHFNNTFVENNSWTQSVSSSQQKKKATQPIMIQRNIIVNPILGNRAPPSTRSSSNQSKNSVKKQTIVYAKSPMLIRPKNSPPLPPMRPPQRNIQAVNPNLISYKQIPTNMVSKSIQRRNSSYNLSTQKIKVTKTVVSPTLTQMLPRGGYENLKQILSPKNYERMNYSAVTPYRDLLPSQRKQKYFDPPHIVSVPVSPIYISTSNQVKFPLQNQAKLSKTQIVHGSENSIAISSDAYLRRSSNSHSGSKSRSGSKSKKGIKVVSQKPRKADKFEFSYF